MNTTEATGKPARGGLPLAFGGLLALGAAMGVGRFVYTPILPAMIDALAWSKSEAGLVASANFLGYLIGALAAARSGGLASVRTQLISALVVSVVATAAMAASTALPVFVVVRLIGGIASAFVIVTSSTLVLQRLAAGGRGQLSAVHFAGVGAGIMASALLVAALTAAGAGWQELWWGAAALALAAAVLAITLIPRGPDGAGGAGATSTKPGAELWRLVIAYGLFGFGYVITSTFIVTIVRSSIELKPLEPSIWALFGFAAIPSVALWTWIAGRIGTRQAFAVACVLEAIGVILSVGWSSSMGIVGSAVLIGGTFMGLTALGLSAARQLAPGAAQSSIGWMTASFAFGQMIGPVVAGLMFDRFGSFAAPSGIAAIALVLAAALVLGPGASPWRWGARGRA